MQVYVLELIEGVVIDVCATLDVAMARASRHAGGEPVRDVWEQGDEWIFEAGTNQYTIRNHDVLES